METAHNSDISENVKRPLPEGTIVCFKDLYNKACIGRVKASGMYILWVEGLRNRDVSVFIRYSDLIWVLE